MRATINGITVEGTPAEIAELMMIMQTEMTAAIKGVDITVDIPEPKWPSTMSHDDVFEQVLDKLSAQTKCEINKLSEEETQIYRSHRELRDELKLEQHAQALQEQINNVNAMHEESENAKSMMKQNQTSSDGMKTLYSQMEDIKGMGDVIGDVPRTMDQAMDKANVKYGIAQGRKPSPIDALHGHDINFLQKIATDLRQEGGGEAWAIGKMVELAIEEHGQSGIMKTK